MVFCTPKILCGVEEVIFNSPSRFSTYVCLSYENMTQIVPASASVLRTVILGAPASGKGTVSGRIVKQFNWFHLSCGDILRLHQQNKTTLGLEAAKYISSGKLVPDSVVTQCILDNLQTVPAEKSWLLDGFPRTIQQVIFAHILLIYF